MKQEYQETLAASKKFQQASMDLYGAMMNENYPFGSEEYPFEKDFEQVITDIVAWHNHQVKLIDSYNTKTAVKLMTKGSKFVLVNTPSLERWANELFATPFEAMQFAEQNNLYIINLEINIL